MPGSAFLACQVQQKKLPKSDPQRNSFINHVALVRRLTGL